MLRSQFRHSPQRPLPALYSLSGNCRNQINTYIIKSGTPHQFPCIQELTECMNPSKHFKLPVIDRLKADTDPVNPCIFPCCRLFLRHCSRVHFQRNLRIFCNIKTLLQRAKNPGGVPSAQHGGSTAAQKYRSDTVIFVIFSSGSDLMDQRVCISMYFSFSGRSGEEIAVCAFLYAERDMHIQLQLSFFHKSAP